MRYTMIMLLGVWMAGCTNRVQLAKEMVDDGVGTLLNNEIRTLSNTLVFYCYSGPENYWYDDTHTAEDIIADEFRLGLARLRKLDADAARLQTRDTAVNLAVNRLRGEIKVSIKDIREAQRSLNAMNDLFGLNLFGGVSGAISWGKLMGRMMGDTTETKDEAGNSFPVNVANALKELDSALITAYIGLAERMADFEHRVSEEIRLNEAGRKIVNDYLKNKVRQQVAATYTPRDSVACDMLLNQILELYETNRRFL